MPLGGSIVVKLRSHLFYMEVSYYLSISITLVGCFFPKYLIIEMCNSIITNIYLFPVENIACQISATWQHS